MTTLRYPHVEAASTLARVEVRTTPLTPEELARFAAQLSETLRAPISIRYRADKSEPAAE